MTAADEPVLRALPVPDHREHTNRERAEIALEAAAHLLRPAVARYLDEHTRADDRPGSFDVAWGSALAELGAGYAALAATDTDWQHIAAAIAEDAADAPVRGEV